MKTYVVFYQKKNEPNSDINTLKVKAISLSDAKKILEKELSEDMHIINILEEDNDSTNGQENNHNNPFVH